MIASEYFCLWVQSIFFRSIQWFLLSILLSLYKNFGALYFIVLFKNSLYFIYICLWLCFRLESKTLIFHSEIFHKHNDFILRIDNSIFFQWNAEMKQFHRKFHALFFLIRAIHISWEYLLAFRGALAGFSFFPSLSLVHISLYFVFAQPILVASIFSK